MRRVNFTDILIKGKEIYFELVGIQVIRVQVNQVKNTGKWGEIQGNMNLVWVSREFELSGFYFKEMYGVQSGESVFRHWT